MFSFVYIIYVYIILYYFYICLYYFYCTSHLFCFHFWSIFALLQVIGVSFGLTEGNEEALSISPITLSLIYGCW